MHGIFTIKSTAHPQNADMPVNWPVTGVGTSLKRGVPTAIPRKTSGVFGNGEMRTPDIRAVGAKLHPVRYKM